MDRRLRDRQSKTRAAFLSRRAAVDLLEFIEDACLIFGRDAGPGIADCHVEAAVDRAGVDLDRAGIGEFDRIADDVEQDLGQTAFIAGPGGKVWPGPAALSSSPFLRQRAGRGDDGLDERLHRVVVERQLS